MYFIVYMHYVGILKINYCEHCTEWKALRCVSLCVVKVKVKFTLEQATKAQRGSRGIALLFP